jgi:flagellar basal body-associated protein FliL
MPFHPTKGVYNEGMADALPEKPSEPAVSAPPAEPKQESPKQEADKADKKTSKAVKTQAGGFGGIFGALGSSRLAPKFWAMAFLVSLVGMGVTGVKAVRIWLRHQAEAAAHRQATSPEEIEAHEKSEKKRLGEEYLKRNLNLGVFQFQMKPSEGDARAQGVRNIAQIEIAVLCDTVATCEWISSHLQTVKDQVSAALAGFSRHNLMNSAGKQSVQEKVLIKVNVSLPEGRVERVFFTKMVLS